VAQRRSRIDAEATRWAVRFSAGALASHEQDELDRWLQEDSRHRGALVRARAMWLDLDRVAALRGQREQSPVQGNAASTHEQDAKPWRFRLLAVAAVLVAVVGSTAWWMERNRGDVYVSAVGEVRRVTLTDGSIMLLNTASKAVVHFDRVRREVQLVRGEGLFEVANSAARPFIVRVGEVSVRALGTVFDVRASDERVDVTVTEGAVEVGNSEDPRSREVRKIGADERAAIVSRLNIRVEGIHRDEAERQLAWRDGMADFDGESLADAVQEINKHNRRHIVVDDPALAHRPVVGTFRASDAEGFATTIAAALDAERIDEEDVIHLRPRPSH
jgi:transmembrane sensor